MLEIKGIDLSTWQKEVDWQEVKSDGVHFAILRAGFGNGSRDEMFESHKGFTGSSIRPPWKTPGEKPGNA